jgi:salicylate hydroxylase
MVHGELTIIGAGIGGLTAALALQRSGVRVRLYEQAATLQAAGAGVMLTPNATRVLRGLGLGEALARASFSPKFTSVRDGRTGELLSETPLGKDGQHADGSPYFHLHRADLQALLLAAVLANDPQCLRLGATLAGLRVSGQAIVATFADGSEVECRALVGADGLKSRVRTHVAPGPTARFTGNVAWRGLVPTADLRPQVRAPEGIVWVGERRHVVRYAVRGGSVMNYVAIAERTSWEEEGWMVRASVADVVAEFADWHPDVSELLAATPSASCFKWGLFDRDPLPAWTAGPVTLLGDAAHPMLPFMAQGAAMAIEDGAVLARKLGESADVVAAFAAYEAARIPRTSWVQEQSRRNQQLYHDGSVGRQFDADRALRAERLYDYDALKV